MNTAEGAGWPEGIPPAGTFVRDTTRKRDAVVMAAVGGYIQLRGPEGGVEWDAKPEDIQPLAARDELRVRLAVQDAAARSRVGR